MWTKRNQLYQHYTSFCFTSPLLPTKPAKVNVDWNINIFNAGKNFCNKLNRRAHVTVQCTFIHLCISGLPLHMIYIRGERHKKYNMGWNKFLGHFMIINCFVLYIDCLSWVFEHIKTNLEVLGRFAWPKLFKFSFLLSK